MRIRFYNRLICFFIISLVCTPPIFAYENPLFGYTHLLPSPFTLPAGRFVIGSTAGVGITDYLQVETDVIANLYQIYNGRARVSLLDFPGFALGASLGYQNVNLKDFSSSNPSLTIRSWMPGAVLGLEVLPGVALFMGGRLFYSNIETSSLPAIQTSGLLQGGQIESDLSWAYQSNEDRFGNVLSGGVTYNTTFEFYGVGISHHWKGFQLGLHYYPNATQLKVVPIASFGATFAI